MASAAAAASGTRDADAGPRAAGRGRSRAPARRVPPPLEHRILLTAALCLLALGAVMVYSASSPRDLLGAQGNGTRTFVRYLIFGAIGLGAMNVFARRGLALLDQRLVTMLLLGSLALMV